MLTNTRPDQPLAPVLPTASTDHFRYPLFHFCYPSEPLRFLLFPLGARLSPGEDAQH